MFQALENLKRFQSDPIAFINALDCGTISRVPLGHKRFHFIFDEEAAAHVLLKNVSNYKKSRLIFDKIVPITGKKGIVQLEDEEWNLWRFRSGPMFSKEAINGYSEIINYNLAQALKKLDAAALLNERIDIRELFVSYTINSAVQILLGCTNNELSKHIAQDFMELNFLCGQRMRNFLSLPLFIKNAQNKKLALLQQRLRANIAQLIEHAASPSHPPSLLKHLVDTLPERNNSNITDQLMTFLFAGFETTAASLTFCFYLLAKSKNAQEFIRKESANFKEGQNLELDQIRGYYYTIAAYKEALRLFPPAWILARQAGKDDVIGSHIVKKNDNIIICIRQIHRKSQLWSNPHSFVPERFMLKDEHAAWRKNKCAFMPFGVGQRICSGHQLAMLEAINAIVQLCRQFVFSNETEHEIPIEAMVTLMPKNPVYIKVAHV